MAILAGMVIGGFIAVWVLQGLINWLIISRVMDDPFKGKMLATIIAFFTAAILYWMSSGSPIGFATYLPGALVVGWLEMRSAKKVQERIDAQDQTATFE